MRSGDKRAQNLLVTAMNAIEDTNSQPGVMQPDGVERIVMLHGGGGVGIAQAGL
jgi:hypothetical protein